MSFGGYTDYRILKPKYPLCLFLSLYRIEICYKIILNFTYADIQNRYRSVRAEKIFKFRNTDYIESALSQREETINARLGLSTLT